MFSCHHNPWQSLGLRGCTSSSSLSSLPSGRSRRPMAPLLPVLSLGVLHSSEISPGDKVIYFESNKSNSIKIGLQVMANLWTRVKLKNCNLENSSILFGSLDQYLGNDKRRV